MKRLLFFFVGFCLHWQVAAQANLVPNPGFEDTIHGPIGSINGILGTCVKDWYSPNTNPGDGAWYYYFGPNLPMPTGLEYIYLPNSGIGMIKIGIVESFNPIRREYTQCQLIDSMRSNETYYVSYFVKRYNLPSMCLSNGTSLFFSDTAIIRINSNSFQNIQNYGQGFFDLSASVTSFQEEIISDTNKWTKIEAVYQAQGGEQFITLGNFNTNQNTKFTCPNSNITTPTSAYLYDDITVMHIDSLEKPLVAYAGPDTTIHILDSVFIGRKISNLNCNWYELNGPLIASNTSGIVVKPLVNTTYVVEQILANQLTYDTVTVFVIGGVGIAENRGNNSVTISPNPNKGTFQLHVQQYVEQLMVSINDVNGTNVYSSTLAPEQAIVHLPESVASGVYFVHINTAKDQAPVVLRIIVN